MAEEMLKLAQEVTMKEKPEEALGVVLKGYLERRIAECKGEIKNFESKYDMSFVEFEEKLGKEFGLSYEHEMDYARWGAKLDELEELEKQLRNFE